MVKHRRFVSPSSFEPYKMHFKTFTESNDDGSHMIWYEN